MDLDDLPGEEWLDVVGYEGRCRVSNLGRVKSLPNSRRKDTNILAQGRKPPTGYMVVNLSNDGKAKTIMVHTLVLTAFVGPCPPGLEARHANNETADNALSVRPRRACGVE